MRHCLDDSLCVLNSEQTRLPLLGADATERRAVRLKIYRQKNKAALYQKKKAYMAANPDKVKGWKRADYERQIVIDQHFRI